MPTHHLQIKRSWRYLIVAVADITAGVLIGALVTWCAFTQNLAAGLIIGIPFGFIAAMLLATGIQTLPIWALRAVPESRRVHLGVRRSRGRMITLLDLPSHFFSQVRFSSSRSSILGGRSESVWLDRGLLTLLVACEADARDSMLQVARTMSSNLLLPLRENRW